MKKIIFTILIVFCPWLDVSAQNKNAIEFMGLSLCDNDTAAFSALLKDKGYTLIGEKDGTRMFKGIFANLAAEAVIVPFDGSDRVNAVFIRLNDLNPIKMGKLYSELLQKFMSKYQDYKYDTQVNNKGATTTSFRNDMGFIALETEVTGLGKGRISIYYSCSKPMASNEAEKRGNISVDDL